MGSVVLFLYKKFVLLLSIIFLSLYTCIIPLFRSHFLRIDEGSKKKNSENLEFSPVKSRGLEELKPVVETESKPKHDLGNIGDGFSKKEETGFSFQFKFPSYEEFCKNRGENVNNSSLEPVHSNYEFTPAKDLSGFIKEPEILKITDEIDDPFGYRERIGDGVLPIDKELPLETEDKEKQSPNEEQLQLNSESESIRSSPLDSSSNGFINSYSDGFLSDSDFEDEFEAKKDEHKPLDEIPEQNEAEMKTKNTGKSKPKFLSEKDFSDESKNDSKIESDWDSDELWEHQELIEQLKTELKKVKATGLPTILEDSESPKIADDLKPWKIDEKLRYGDRSGELHKFYKSYRERMRKLDILNYQKMYAMGFLRLKDPLQSISSQKSTVLSVSTLLSHNLFPSKRKKVGNDPTMKFVIELQSDLEIVYVGHMCLSWEILHWQYGKALELWESDPRGIRIYNEVAGDFQQFQVLMQRFIEDEAFQGPRVQTYVKSRCALRNLLQVPLIKEDNLKDRKKAYKRREMGDFAITSDTLVEILEESIRIFWRFVRADKDCSYVGAKSRKGLHIELQDPADSDLLMEVQADLLKKEKRLKDLLRGGSCILKKLKKHEEDESDQVLYFFSQVDMKLVCRVLNMPRITTDQLIWCRNKLQKISLVNKKIKVDPAFLLFPC